MEFILIIDLAVFISFFFPRLDEFKKQLIAERDDILKESREQQAKLDIINSQIELVSKVISKYRPLSHPCTEEFEQASMDAQSKVTELVPSRQNVVENVSTAMDATGGPAIIITPTPKESSSQTP